MDRVERWKELYENSERLTRPYSIDHVLARQEMIDLEKSVVKIINCFLDKAELHKGIKIYTNNHQRNDLVEKMAKMRPAITESLKDWGVKIFGQERYGVVFNSLEAYDNTISEIMSFVVSPLIKKAGLPLGGLSFLFFMGNYGFTPFGIHKEAKGEEGFLFHLGPAEKVFYTWDNEELNKIEHNTKVFHEELKDMLPTSKEYVLKPGSVMFIPHQVYHIAKTEEFSLSIVMDYINPSRDLLEKELAKEISAQEYPQNLSDSYLNPIQLDGTGKGSESSLDVQSIMKKYRIALDRRVTMLKSNGGLLNPAIKNHKKLLPNGEFSFKGKEAFPICINEPAEDSIIIYARGNEIKRKSNPYLNTIISSLNNGEVLTFEYLKEQLMPQWDLVEIYSLISDLLVIEAIKIFESNHP